MNADEQTQIELVVARALDRGQRDLKDKLKRVYADHSARGLLASGATIKVGIRVMEEVARGEMQFLLFEAGQVSRSQEAYEIVIKSVGELLDMIGQALLEVIRMATRGRDTGSINSAALGLFRQMRSDIEADLIIARHNFLAGEGESEEAGGKVIERKVSRNPGGKPLAAHWDTMWAAIAVDLYLGDLKPKTQADIEAAMHNWLSAREIGASESTVRSRARQLWQAIQERE